MEIKLPKDVAAEKVGPEVRITGPKGEVTKRLFAPNVDIIIDGGKIGIESKRNTKREIRMKGTFAAHIKNMIKGVVEGFTYKMKVCYSHFPMTVKVEGKAVVIDNFIGGKVPKRVKIPEGVEVGVNGDEISVVGIDLDKVSGVAGSIEQATRIVGKDRRVFQDGIYIVQKG